MVYFMSDRVNTNNPKTNQGKKVVSPPKDDINSIRLPSSPNDIMYRGYFPIWRKIREWGWYKDSNTKAVFLELLLLSNHKENDYLGNKILPGQCITGRKKLALDLGLSERQIRTALSHLKSTSEVSIKNCNKFSIITLNNYLKYTITTSDKSSNRPATDQQPTTPKNVEKEKNEEEVKTHPFKQPSLEEIKAYCKENSHTIDAEKFFNHYEANGWYRGKTKIRNWKACVKTWLVSSTPTQKERTNYV